MGFHPYPFFGGNCRDAFIRYQEIFGGELVLLALSDLRPEPGEGEEEDDRPDQIMYASLTMPDGFRLMGADDPSGRFRSVQGMAVSYTVTDPDEAERVFEALADGGTVFTPLMSTFFSPKFGMCVDQFRTPWMVITEAAPSS